MAGDFGNRAVSKRDINPAVACANYIVNIIQGHAGIFQRPIHGVPGAIGAIRTGAHIGEGVRLAIDHYHCLRTDRTNIDTCGYHLSPFPVD